MGTFFRAALGLVGVAMALAVVGVLGWEYLQPPPPHGLDASQRAAPTIETIDGTPMIVQRTDQFAMPAIDGLALVPNDTVIANMFAAQPLASDHWAGWRWMAPSGVPMLMVVLDIEPEFGDERRARYVDGVVAGIESTPLPEGFAPYVHETTGTLDHTFRSLAPEGGGGMFVRVFGYEDRSGWLVVASITVAGLDLPSLEAAARAAHAID